MSRRMPQSSPSPSAAAFSQTLAAGALVMYENDGNAYLASVLGEKNRKINVLNMRGREVELPGFRLLSLGFSSPKLGSSKELAEWLLATYESASKAIIGIAELYDLASMDGGTRDSRSLTELVITGSPSLNDYLSIRLALLNDRIYFKRQEDSFSPRPPDVVAQLKHADGIRQERAARLERLSQIFLERISGANASTPGASGVAREDEASIVLLKRLAAESPEVTHDERRAIKELMNDLVERGNLTGAPGSDEARALYLLERARLLTPDENLAIIRHGIPREPTPEAIAEANALARKPVTVSEERRDLTNVWCCSIDDVTTKDMDDALSIEELPGSSGYRLGIHISDCGALIPPSGALDENARERATSLYLAGETIHMLPVSLSEDYASLRAGELRYAQSVMIDLDIQMRMKSFEIIPSIIKSAQRYTYEEVDKLLQQNHKQLMLLREAANSHEQFRIENGSSGNFKREVLVSRAPDGSLALQVIEEDSPARSLVAELMVMGNRCIAEFGRDKKIPLVFRGQDKPDEPTGHESAEELAAFGGKRLKKSFVGFVPMPHSGLGLKAYVQATSPIRRYIDMCHQRQIASFLRCGKPFYSEDEFRTILQSVEPTLAAAQTVSKETKRYWHLVYLVECMRSGEPLTGTVTRKDTRTPLVELDVLSAAFFAKIKPSHEVGSRVTLKVVACRPREGFVKFEEL